MIAAPFLGEFGWEVSLWVPWLRHQMLRHYQGRDLTVICRQGHEYLYEDFAEKTLSFAVGKPVDRVDCQHVWIDGHRLTKPDYMTMASVALRQKSVRRSRDTITPIDLRVHWHGDAPPSLKQSEYRPYGSREKQKGWIAVHPRHCAAKQPERDWPEFKWHALLEQFEAEHIILVGSKPGAMSLPGCEDLRGHPLREVCDAISRCQLIVGPSSGPLALAMLCCTQVVWWSGNLKDQPRFKNVWNPFNVETQQAGMDWDPDPDEVEVACQKFL